MVEITDSAAEVLKDMIKTNGDKIMKRGQFRYDAKMGAYANGVWIYGVRRNGDKCIYNKKTIKNRRGKNGKRNQT